MNQIIHQIRGKWNITDKRGSLSAVDLLRPTTRKFLRTYSIGSVTGYESKEARKSWTTSHGTLIDWRPWHVLWLPVASQCQNNYRRESTVAKWLGTNHSLNLIKYHHQIHVYTQYSYARELIECSIYFTSILRKNTTKI